MDDPSAQQQQQVQNLKNLNSMLLKETSQHRHQIEGMEEKNAALHLEKSLLFVFMETRMREMGFILDKLVEEKNEVMSALSETESEVAVFKGEVNEVTRRLENEKVEMGKVREEREKIRDERDDAVSEVKGLKEKLLESENRESEVRDEVEKMRLEGERLLEEGREKDRKFEELKKDLDSAKRSYEESGDVIEKLKDEIEAVTREKNESEKVKNDQEVRIVGLGFEIEEIDQKLKDSRSEGASMRARIAELEGSLGIAVEKEEEMEAKIRDLLREKKETEKSIEMLVERGESTKKVLGMVQKGLDDKQREIDEVIRARDEIENVKVMRENEIVELKSEVNRLRDAEHDLEESRREFEEKNKQLLSEVDHLRNSIVEARTEKDNIRKGFEGEKDKVENLSLLVKEMKGKFEQTTVELEQLRSEREKLIEKNKMMESHVGVLTNEKDTLQRSHQEAQREHNDLRAKFEYSNQALAMLKNTAAFVCQHKDSEGVEEVISMEKKVKEEIQTYVEEQLDAIRNAFKSKNETVDDMKQQIESLQKSVAEANKNKTLLPVISSATTIFAAALTAYVTRRR